MLNLQGAYACSHGPHLCEVAAREAGKEARYKLVVHNVYYTCLLASCLPASSRLNHVPVGVLHASQGLRRLAIHGNPLSHTATATLTAYLDKQGCRLMPL